MKRSRALKETFDMNGNQNYLRMLYSIYCYAVKEARVKATQGTMLDECRIIQIFRNKSIAKAVAFDASEAGNGERRAPFTSYLATTYVKRG